jgi:hypothetical protein
VTGANSENGPTVPPELRNWWTQDLWSLKTADWIRQLSTPTGLFANIQTANMPDGWRHWLAWHHFIAPDNHTEINVIRAYARRTMGYVQVVAERMTAKCEEYCSPDPLKTFPTLEYKTVLLLAT